MNTSWGILAHVDAGKTTLSESILYNAGLLASTGRVDHGDAFLDTDQQEKDRGITIFSKPAVFDYQGEQITLVDTPGHVDFATETERAIWAMDFAILLVSGTDGVQAHTKTLFDLLIKNQVPTIIFINKMDMEGSKTDFLLSNLKEKLSPSCHHFLNHEDIASEDEDAMEEFFENGRLCDDTIINLTIERKIYPVFLGSALKNQGVKELLSFMKNIGPIYGAKTSSKEFGGRIYKIESFANDTRLTFTKITSGSIKVKDTLTNGQKVDQIRLYSGSKYQQLDQATAGQIVALVGPKNTFAGQGLGIEKDRPELSLSPVLRYKLNFLDDTIPKVAFQKLLAFNDEDPSLNVFWNSDLEEISFNLMGQVQTEIILKRIEEGVGIKAEFVEAGILYKETLARPVEGVGHFEPLRHYAEVHLFMEPLESGKGIVVDADVSTDDLALNWQRLIATHILERDHIGTSIGAPVTDIKFTIVGGRAHIKHTEGGDFREATYRAIRQGLMEAGTIILEPYFNFEIKVPTGMIGKVMTDMEVMFASFDMPEEKESVTLLRGKAPASTIRNYQSSLITYTKGQGQISLTYAGYDKCHNENEVLEAVGYIPDKDIDNPVSSVFCSHGSAEIVSWELVKEYCHVPCREVKKNKSIEGYDIINQKRQNHSVDEWLDPDEIDKILNQATHSNQGKNPKKGWHYGDSSRPRRADSDYVYTPPKEIKAKEKYLLVDGYNLIYAWPELKEVLDVNLDGARGKLLDILSNYKAMTDYNVIVVFDAYKVKGRGVTAEDYLNIHQIFTAEAQTADAYIERFTHEHEKKYDITVVTSDGLEQVIIRGAGAKLMSSREFIEEVARAAKELKEKYNIK